MANDVLGNKDWEMARNNLLIEFARIVSLDLNQRSGSKADITDPFIVPVLAGFISVADWIGSNQDFFPYAAECGEKIVSSAGKYWVSAQDQAEKALYKLGWLPCVNFAKETRFDFVFRGLTANALQEKVAEFASKQTSPYLMIAEAPMGIGKTEAALYAADLAVCRGFARGIYVAMPTQATSNAMFERILEKYLKKRGHQGRLNLQLVHGDALLAQMAEVREGEIPNFQPRDIEEEKGDLEAQSWFTAKKRPLLAPFGVGTIDQCLLSVLKTKHWFVRLLGLAGKVIIFDEVHAYDSYMSTIIERLLRWLAELDCTVILLSATLPEAKRKTLAKAFSGQDERAYNVYPRITLAKPCHYQNNAMPEPAICFKVPTEESQTIGIDFAKTELGSLSETLTVSLKNGGCAAVICNTVDRSIEVYKHLRDRLKGTECLLFHARTLQMWRREREEEILRKFGKGEKQADGTYANPQRPLRAVLVATQVIEQSLDLDFDLMISEIAPIDLLLQRLGRLHRHPRKRPDGLESPRLIMLCEAQQVGPPPESFGEGLEFVYDRYILLRTWLTLRNQSEIKVPSQIETLVEEVYALNKGSKDNNWMDALEKAKSKMESEHSESERVASKLIVSKPKDPHELIEDFNEQLREDEDPEVHRSIRAATREGDPSITIIFLPSDVPLTPIPEVRKLLDHSAKLSHRGVFQATLEKGEIPGEWRDNAHLRHARLLRLNGQNQGRVGNYLLTVDENLGIVIEKDGDNHG